MDYQNKINQLRKKDIQNFQTNYFFTPFEKIENILETPNALIFITKEKEFHKLFFAFVDINDFEKLLKKVNKSSVYLEIIAKGKLDYNLEYTLNKYFTYKTTYQKLYKKLEVNEKKEFPQSIINTDLIYEKIYSTFNIYFEHLMNKKELQLLAEDKKIITIYENNEMKSFLIYKTQNTKAYLNHIANYGSKQNLIDLWSKFYQALNYEGIKYLDLWYDKQNKKAENMYNIEQFQPLNMYKFCYEKILL